MNQSIHTSVLSPLGAVMLIFMIMLAALPAQLIPVRRKPIWFLYWPGIAITVSVERDLLSGTAVWIPTHAAPSDTSEKGQKSVAIAGSSTQVYFQYEPSLSASLRT